jgi:hypothetical protein
MKLRAACVVVGFLSLSLSLAQLTVAQTTTETASALPRLVRFGGTVKDLNGNLLTGVVGITFALYSEQTGGAALWLETQNVTADSNGHYTVLLGSTKPDGLPTDLFTTEQARWVGVQVSGQAEQPRVLLVSAPYALKAGDAETVGGLPASAFVLAAPAGSSTSAPAIESNTSSAGSAQPAGSLNVTTTGGTANTISMFTTATNIQNSAISQTGSGATAKIGIGTTAPAATLDVKGGADIRGLLSLPATGTATATKGFNSEPQSFVASVFNSGTATAVAQTFQFQAEPLNNDKTTASGTLNLLYATGTASPAETGLKISSKGLITFGSGQIFPGTGAVTSVGLSAPASDFTVSGSPVKTSGTLKFAWNVTPTSTLTPNAIVKRDNSGNFGASIITANALNAAQVTLTDAFSVSSGEVTPLSASSSNTGATTIYSAATATTGTAWAVEGETFSSASNAYGVYGYAASGTGSPRGVFGQAASNSGVGVFGQNSATESSVGSSEVALDGAGVWGDGGTAGASNFDIPGVVGTADDSNAGYFENNSVSNYPTLSVRADGSTTSPFFAFNGAHSCNIDHSGNLNCTGTKNAVVPIDGGKRIVAMSAIESPQNWFEDFGSAQLNGGSAVVPLDRDFIQTVNTEREYMVIPVPNGECRGLYVTSKTATSFEVRELGGGTSGIRFDYRIVALRKNYENVRFADHTNDPNPMKQMRHRGQPGKLETKPAMPPVKKSALVHPAMAQSAGK